MPTITVDGPKIEDIELKRQMVKTLTDAAYEVYKIEHILCSFASPTPFSPFCPVLAERFGLIYFIWPTQLFGLLENWGRTTTLDDGLFRPREIRSVPSFLSVRTTYC